MPRRIRLFVPGGIYHVYNRVTRGEHVFEHETLSEHWVDSVAAEMRLHEIKVLAWCLMTNHFHLVVKTGALPLWRAMARLQARVAREHNRRIKVRGPLWQSRYKARLVKENGDLENLVAYVHLNPVTAGMVEDPADYSSSGHRAMIGLEPPRLLDVAEALLTFDEDPEVGRFVYFERLQSAVAARWNGQEVGDLPWWREVDDNELTMPNENPPPEAATFEGDRLPPEDHLRPPIDWVLELFETRAGLPAGHLSGSSRSRLDKQFRCMFSTFAVCYLGFRACDVAGLLHKARGSVSRWISEGYELQKSDGAFRAELESLRREIEVLYSASCASSRTADHEL